MEGGRHSCTWRILWRRRIDKLASRARCHSFPPGPYGPGSRGGCRMLLRCAIALAVLSVSGFIRAAEMPQKYREVIQDLDSFIAHEVAAKELPALSIALVDDQTVLWSKGF